MFREVELPSQTEGWWQVQALTLLGDRYRELHLTYWETKGQRG